MSELRANGAEFYYEDSGSGPPLIFIHGTGGNANSSWDEQVRRLNPDYRCITYDRRGNRRSAAVDSAVSIETHADDAAALMDALEATPCVVVGLSWGGAIAIDLMRRHASSLRGAVLGEPTALALDPSESGKLLRELQPKINQAVAEGGPAAGVDAFYSHVCASFWSRLDDAQRQPFRANHAGMFSDLQSPPYAISSDDLKQIEMPCLVLRGSHTTAMSRSLATIVGLSIPGAQLVDIQGSGHVVFSEQPDQCADAIRRFAYH